MHIKFYNLLQLFSHRERIEDRFELNMALTVVFWLVDPCSSDKTQRFEGTYHLHLQGPKASQGELILALASAGFSLGLLLDPESKGDSSALPTWP
jgi:hypothetical protein